MICPSHLHPSSLSVSSLTLFCSFLTGFLDASEAHHPTTAPRPLHRLSLLLGDLYSPPLTFWRILLHCYIHLGLSLNTSYEVAISDSPIMSDHPYLLYFSPLHFSLSDLVYINWLLVYCLSPPQLQGTLHEDRGSGLFIAASSVPRLVSEYRSW